MQTRGSELISALVENVANFKSKVQSNFDLPIFLDPSEFAEGRFELAKIVVRVNQLGASGVDIEKALQSSMIRVEMADQDTVVFLATLADSIEEFDHVAEVLIPILRNAQKPARPTATSLSWSVVPTVGISMRDAYFAQTEMVSASEAVGRISADLIAPYPPGVAVVAPGEVLTKQILEGLATTKGAGVRIAYATDSTLTTYRIVKN